MEEEQGITEKLLKKGASIEDEEVTYIGKLFMDIWESANKIVEKEDEKYNISNDSNYKQERLDKHIVEMMSLFESYCGKIEKDN